MVIGDIRACVCNFDLFIYHVFFLLFDDTYGLHHDFMIEFFTTNGQDRFTWNLLMYLTPTIIVSEQ